MKDKRKEPQKRSGKGGAAMMLERRLERLEDFPKEAAAQRLASLRGRLVRQQGLLKEGGLPVLIRWRAGVRRGKALY